MNVEVDVARSFMQYRLIWSMSFGGIRRDLLFLSGDHLLSGPCTFRFSIYFIFLFSIFIVSIILFIYTCRRYGCCCSVRKQKLSSPCACINGPNQLSCFKFCFSSSKILFSHNESLLTRFFLLPQFFHFFKFFPRTP